MYDRLFGLAKSPFNVTPDSRCLYLTSQHREALVGVTYAMLRRRGFVVLTGEAGTGKTSLVARALRCVPPSRVQFGVILNPTVTTAEFLEMVLLDFGVSDIPSSKARRLWILQNLLLDGEQQGKISALIVDEAHKLSPDVLEEIRLLGNFEVADHKLLQVVLVGQSELEDHLDRQDLRQLKQRITLWLRLAPLALADVSGYIRYRWAAAGGRDAPFSIDAMNCIGQASHGIPRLINTLCDTALTLALGDHNEQVKSRHVLRAAAEMRITAAPDMVIADEGVARPGEPDDTPTELCTRQNIERQRGSIWAKWADRIRQNARQESALTEITDRTSCGSKPAVPGQRKTYAAERTKHRFAHPEIAGTQENG